jgi:hypothetical protein
MVTRWSKPDKDGVRYPYGSPPYTKAEIDEFERRTERGPVAFTRPDPPSMTPPRAAGPISVAHGPVAAADKEQPPIPKPPQRSPVKRRGS